MAKFTVTLYETSKHTFTVDARSEDDAIKLARAKFDAFVDSETCISLGLDLGRPPTAALPHNAADQTMHRPIACEVTLFKQR
jgi:hypothetical protein